MEAIQIKEKSNLSPIYDRLAYSLLTSKSDGEIFAQGYSERCIYMLATAKTKYINQEYAKNLDIPIYRTLLYSGKPTSMVYCPDSIVLTFLNKGSLLSTYEKTTSMYFEMLSHVLPELNLELRNNDIEIVGTNKKIAGVGWLRLTEKITFSVVAINLSQDDVELDKLFLMPKHKFDDKVITSVAERTTSLSEQLGRELNKDVLFNKFCEYLEGITDVEIGEINKEGDRIMSLAANKYDKESWREDSARIKRILQKIKYDKKDSNRKVSEKERVSQYMELLKNG